MVRPPRSRYEAHPQVREQGYSSCSSLHRSFSLRWLSPSTKPLISQRSPKLDRRKGFSNRATAIVFIATIINFLLSSVNAGTQVVQFIVFIRKVLILDIDHPLSEKRELVDNALHNLDIVNFWAADLPVSVKLSLCRIPHPFMLGGAVAQQSRCRLEGLGPLPRSTVGNPLTVYSVDRGRR
jgi:hypothetical protein